MTITDQLALHRKRREALEAERWLLRRELRRLLSEAHGAGMTQAELADALGVSKQYISQLMTGKR